MAHSRPSSRVCLAVLACAGVLGVVAQAPALAVASLEKCNGVDIDSGELRTNFKTNVTELPNVTITGCNARIQALKASTTNVDFANSKWTFEGNVRIRIDQPQQGTLKSDRAVVDFQNSQIQSVTITGSPAEFEQTGTQPRGSARGRAGKIVYDFSTGTVTLSDDAWLADDAGKEIKSPQIVYDFNRQALVGTAKSADGANGRVKITINPQAAKKNGSNASPAPPTGQATPRDTPPASPPAPAKP
jgi:lipopolysaccharide transport protein LptA